MLSAGILLTACGPLGLRRQPAAPLGLGAETREQPALSGDGRLLASLVERGGRTTVLLQDRRSGQVLPLRHLRRQQPHSSPSLSWTGRYLAVLVQQGPHRQAVIEDRASGRLQPLFLPSGRTVISSNREALPQCGCFPSTHSSMQPTSRNTSSRLNVLRSRSPV